ncbi:MAG: PRD domain-containing protein [Oscillospiraceae bacterium]|nr:PRD domain-containing protein [Oscillospiraceae bacterium]
MKTNKDRILDLIQLHFASAGAGATTQYVADALGIKRTNASAMLNELVGEGKIEKSGSRPVLYSAPQAARQEYESFDNLAGKDGSLSRIVKLIKAAVQYPGGSLNMLITGEKGTGRTLAALVAYKFAVECGALPPDATYAVCDCRECAEDERSMEAMLFGDAGRGGLLGKNGPGVAVVDNAELLAPRLRRRLCDAAEQNGEAQNAAPILIAISDLTAREATEEYKRRFPIAIELPALADRPFAERLELIRRFFTLEAARAKKSLTVSAELLRCLLLYDCDYNISQLKGDIKIGCASAYVRGIADDKNCIEITNGDFDYYVRKGFLNYRKHRAEIEQLIDSDYSYTFSESSMQMSPVDRDKLLYSENLYTGIDRRVSELRARGMTEKDISLLVETELEANFNAYRAGLARQVVDREQLSKLVDGRVIELAEEFLASAAEKFGESYPVSVHYGLCLHIDSALRNPRAERTLAPEQISDIIENHKEKYLLAFRFASRIEQTFAVRLPVDEIVLIAMFICFEAPSANAAGTPTLLLAFHGDGIATALACAVNTVTGLGNVEAVDIPYGMTSKAAYELLRQTVERADVGFGILALYDAEATKNMLLPIAQETGREIRCIQFPILQFCVECARGAASSGGLDALYRKITERMNAFRTPLRHVIVTLCTTGEGGAVQLKEYIERYGDAGGCAIIPLAISDRDTLREKLAGLMRDACIDCVVGTYDPKLFALPFISAGEVLGVPPERLPSVLHFKKKEKSKIDFEEVYDYLGEQLEKVDIAKLRRILPGVMESMNDKVCELSLDAEVGLFIHIACCLNRLLEGEPVRPNLHKEEIIRAHAQQFKNLLALLKPLEKAFGVVFCDDEIANILMIANKL